MNLRRYSLTDTFRYGYVTNTKIKFVIVVESSNTSLRDNEIRSVRAPSHYLKTSFPTSLQSLNMNSALNFLNAFKCY